MERLLRELVPPRERSRPVPGPPVVVLVEEPCGVDCRLAVTGTGECPPRPPAPFSLRPRLGRVRQDLVDPGLQRRAFLEPADAADDAEPRLLHDLLRDGGRPDVGLGEPAERRVVPVDEI